MPCMLQEVAERLAALDLEDNVAVVVIALRVLSEGRRPEGGGGGLQGLLGWFRP